MVTARLLPAPTQGPAELSRGAGFAPVGHVPPPRARSLGSPSESPPSPGGAASPRAAEGRGGAAGPRHLPMSELQKASCGWMGTQVQASTTKSRRLQLQRNTTRKLSHAVMLPPRCLLTSAEQEDSRCFVRLTLFSLPNSLRAAIARSLARLPARLPACLLALSLSHSGLGGTVQA